MCVSKEMSIMFLERGCLLSKKILSVYNLFLMSQEVIKQLFQCNCCLQSYFFI